MGSSSTSGVDEYGDWRNAYESEKCVHNDELKKVEYIDGNLFL